MSCARSHVMLLPLAGVSLFVWPLAALAEESLRLDHVAVTYSGVDQDYAKALGRTVEAARAAAVEQFGMDMPETITLSVSLDPKGGTRLFCDGQDRLFLTVRNTRDLRKPSSSGVFHIYGMCHELGHLGMYRAVRDHAWLTTAAAEGWAHYLGSRIVDAVFKREGAELWPDRYDYSEDGMKRLEGQLAGAGPSPVVRGAGLWKELVDIVGDKGAARIFQAWGKTTYEPAEPGKSLGEALAAANSDKRLSAWWSRAESEFVFKRPKSGLAAHTAKKEQLVAQPRELAHDDGAAAGKNSFAGSGHAVRFEVPGDSWYLTGVRIHGSRYGVPAPPKEDFHVWLCDKDFKVIADFPFPYGSFARGQEAWVPFEVSPTNVPPSFILCVGFNPTATKGVYVSRDAAAGEHSLVGLPGGGSEPSQEGDWMIRASVDQIAGANAVARDAGENVRPAARPSRKWKDSSGKFEVEAVFLGLEDDTVQLRKADGQAISVPLDKLSTADQQYVRQTVRKQNRR